MSHRPSVLVESEFAPLRTVVLAQSEFRAPDRFDDETLKFLQPEDLERAKSLQGRNLADVDPERQHAWERERNELTSFLEDQGVEVLRPRLLTEVEKTASGVDGYANFFVRDPWFTVGHAVIEGSLRFRHRRSEVLPSRPVLNSRAMADGVAYISVPVPELAADGEDGPGPFLEGGDVLVLGDTVFVGNSGLASNTAGFEWLRHQLTPRGYDVVQIRLQPHVLHLDCAIGLVRPGLLTVNRESLVEDLPEALRDWDHVTVTAQEAMALGTNGLPVTESLYVTDPVFRRIGNELEAHGVKVKYIDFSISRSFGGSFRCSTQPLLRAS